MRTEDILQRLRSGKKDLRARRRSLSLPDKVRQVVELQKVEMKLREQRGEKSDRERVWPVSPMKRRQAR